MTIHEHHVAKGKDNKWRTPLDLAQEVRDVLGGTIQLDPCTGPENHLRLTGLHETQSIDKFSYGLSDRGASIRMPVNFIKNGYKGYLEDRRPNSAADPYLVAGRILKTIQSVPTT